MRNVGTVARIAREAASEKNSLNIFSKISIENASEVLLMKNH